MLYNEIQNIIAIEISSSTKVDDYSSKSFLKLFSPRVDSNETDGHSFILDEKE